jgi:biopolymer transport protein ExbD
MIYHYLTIKEADMAVLVPEMTGGMAGRFAKAEPQPMIEMNTTPLIDVMLVLLIMFIITIPPQSDAVKVDVATGPAPIIESLSNELALTAAGQALWNGQPVDDGTLRSTLGRSVVMNPAPELHFRPDPATSYGRVDQVLAMTAQANVTKLGFIGNQQYGESF